MLRKVIQKCYVYHNSDFLLDFSRRLMDVVQQNNGKVTIVDNGDGTRSMKSVVSEKLLVTFKSENQVICLSYWNFLRLVVRRKCLGKRFFCNFQEIVGSCYEK